MVGFLHLVIEWILTSTEGLLTLFSLFYAKVKCDNGISLSLKQENFKMTLSIENSGSNTGNCFPGDERAERQTGRGGCGNLMISSKGPRGGRLPKPNSQHYLEELKTMGDLSIENERGGRDSVTDRAMLPESERWGEIPWPFLFTLPLTSCQCLSLAKPKWESADTRAWEAQPAQIAPPSHPHIQ